MQHSPPIIRPVGCATLILNSATHVRVCFEHTVLNHHKVPVAHIQEAYCRATSPVLTTDTYYRQPILHSDGINGNYAVICKFQLHTGIIHVKLTRNQSILKKPPFCRMLDHPKIFKCFSDCFLFFRRTLWLSGILGFRQLLILANFNPTFPLNL